MRCELNVYMRPDMLIAHEPCGLFMFILHYIQEWHVGGMGRRGGKRCTHLPY